MALLRLLSRQLPSALPVPPLTRLKPSRPAAPLLGSSLIHPHLPSGLLPGDAPLQTGLSEVELCSPKRQLQPLRPEPVNVTLFGNRVFADVRKMRHPELGWALIQSLCLHKRKERATWSQGPTGGGHVAMEAENGVMQP